MSQKIPWQERPAGCTDVMWRLATAMQGFSAATTKQYK